MKKTNEDRAEEQIPVEETVSEENQNQEVKPTTYTEEQVRSIYNEGQKSGYIAAIKQIRANINDYLNDLIVAASMNSNNQGD
jgi:hypothetical protein